MLNQVVLVGRLTDDVEVVKTENGKSYSTITLAVQRSFKNSEGVYESDFIRCKLWNGIAENSSQYCHKGDIVGIKGRIQVDKFEDKENNEDKFMTEIIAEKVTFLSSKKINKEDQERE